MSYLSFDEIYHDDQISFFFFLFELEKHVPVNMVGFEMDEFMLLSFAKFFARQQLLLEA